MSLPKTSPPLVAAVHAAAAWFEKTKITDMAWQRNDAGERHLVHTPGAGPSGPAITKSAPTARSSATATRPSTTTSMRFRKNANAGTRGTGTPRSTRWRFTPSGAKRTPCSGGL